MNVSAFRRHGLALSLANVVVATLVLGVASSASAQAPKQVRLLMDWFPQANQAGYWQAQMEQPGRAAGIQIVTLPGGPKIQTIPQVASGQAEFGLGNADDVLLARQRGAPVKAVFASLDFVPYTLVYHADTPMKSITELKNKTVAVSLGFAYWEWIKKQHALSGVREIPVSGDLSLFRNDKNMVQQGYSIFLPARMREAGLEVNQFRVAELGYRPYSVLFTTEEFMQKSPDLAKATVAAVKQAWTSFIQNPTATRAMLLEQNKQITPVVHDAAVKEMLETLLPRDGTRLGCMSDARWTELANQLRAVNFLPAGFNERQAYDRSMVTGC
jgi:NitT/TauT family transport system substrate-binding protein